MAEARPTVSDSFKILEAKKFSNTKYFKGHSLYHLTLEERDSYFASFIDGMLYELRTYIMSEKMAEETILWKVKYPENWKEAIKERFFPDWLLTRFPVKYKVETFKKKISAVALFPDLPVVFPGYTGKFVNRMYIEDIK